MPGKEHIRVSLMFVSTHAATKLIKVAQTKPIRPVDDDRVRVGYIESALDDGGGKQYVRFTIHELRHDFLQVVAVHLAMAHNNSSVGKKGSELLRHGVDSHDTI